MLLREIIEKCDLPGLRESLFLGIAEAQELGKEFIGVTLSDGKGLIFKVNPFDETVYSLFLMSTDNIDGLPRIGVFKNKEDITYFIYEINNYGDFFKTLSESVSAVYVEVIGGDLEDFLYRAEGG
ncbi:hypothetical protein IC006_1168 [Sulfuracidifex tepidarius]|uniref:Uncharacterized protein n=1 Tax=Sulfuracidifex tepidarius TaxID=1294262 RepID=A0A510DUH3_9CREN|nr:hypothetical protein IC006_1168 [Sulfuracidifex tepidarius]BBG26627.1 hypothetical protein IC007_1143 [Sulfuracidifex tepidarius]